MFSSSMLEAKKKVFSTCWIIEIVAITFLSVYLLSVHFVYWDAENYLSSIFQFYRLNSMTRTNLSERERCTYENIHAMRAYIFK